MSLSVLVVRFSKAMTFAGLPDSTIVDVAGFVLDGNGLLAKG